MAKQSGKKSWVCTGAPVDPHDDFENFTPNCSVCGMERPNGKQAPNGKKLSVLPIAIASGVAILLVGSWFSSPHIPGLCSALGNCQEWSDRFSKAKQQAASAQDDAGNVTTFAELQDVRGRLDQAIASLRTIPANAKIRPDVQKVLPGYEASLKTLEARLTKESSFQKQLGTANTAATAAAQAWQKTEKSCDMEALEKARTDWEKAKADLEKIPTSSLLLASAKTKTGEYTQKLKLVDNRITICNPPPIDTIRDPLDPPGIEDDRGTTGTGSNGGNGQPPPAPSGPTPLEKPLWP